MKAVILYRPQSEFARQAEEYAHDFERTRNHKLDMLDVDSTQGAEMARLYDLPEYPVLIITEEDGQMVNSWAGVNTFPLMNELATYLQS